MYKTTKQHIDDLETQLTTIIQEVDHYTVVNHAHDVNNVFNAEKWKVVQNNTPLAEDDTEGKHVLVERIFKEYRPGNTSKISYDYDTVATQLDGLATSIYELGVSALLYFYGDGQTDSKSYRPTVSFLFNETASYYDLFFYYSYE